MFLTKRKIITMLAGFLFAPSIHAAEITSVASAFDEDKPFELRLQLEWSYTWHSTKITRENRQTGSDGVATVVNVTELNYRRTLNQIRPALRAGLYRDLEFSFTWPYMILESQNWGPANLPELPASSTIHNFQGICADGRVDPNACGGALFDFTDDTGRNNSYLRGLNNGTLGLRWAILNEDRHPWSATWVVGAGWTFPMFNEREPHQVSHSPGRAEPYADMVNRWSFETALSRRIGLVDPFVRFHYTLPQPLLNSYHNCDQRDSLADMNRQTDTVDNTCSGTVWTRDGQNHGRLMPAHVGGVEFGLEVIPYIDPEHFVKVAVELSAGAAFVSEGRDYTILSDALKRLTYHDEYGHLHATLGLRIQASKHARFHALFNFAHNTPYLITKESVGRDLTGNGVVDLTYTQQDIDFQERNPNFDFRWDQPGRRFRAEETFLYSIIVKGEMHF